MPAQYFIRPTLTPGVVSIDVYSAVSQIAIDKAAPGTEVGFTVNLQSGYTLTSQRAYYANAYGDIIDLELTRTQLSDNSWKFTMADSLVVILCQASSEGGNPGFIFNEGDSSSSIQVNEVLTNTDVLVSTFAFKGYTATDTFVSNLVADISSRVGGYRIYGNIIFSGDRFGIQSYNGAYGSIGKHPYNTIIHSGIYSEIRYSFTSNNGQLTNFTFVSYVVSSSSGAFRYYGGRSFTNEFYTNAVVTTPYFGYIITLSKSIRYILSPENSGEVYGPDTYTNAFFTFTYRIKTAYEFKRIRVFAVGKASGTPPVPREEVISDVTETYDGDTRTYTFTVFKIPDWTIGVRCVIETIYLPNDENASGTNTSDGPIGGNGTFDDTSDEVPLPAIPTGISAADSGFVTLFRPTITQLKDLGNYLWSNLDEFWENLQKIFTNPMDYIIGLNIFPVSPAVGVDKSIYIGNWLTNISMPPVNNQFYEFDCGIRTIDEYFGSFLDYGPNTTARIMLPFIGDRDLAINEIMGKTLHLWYRINLLSGECLAALTINNSVYYQWNGNCAIPIPVTGSDWSRLYGGIAKAAVSVGALAVGGLAAGVGASIGAQTLSGFRENMPDVWLPPAVSNNASQTSHNLPAVRTGPMGLNPDAFGPPYVQEEFGLSRPAQAAIAMTTAGIVGHNIMGSTPRVSHSGDMSGGISIMGNRTPYIVLEYPNVNLPENYKHHYGYPSNQYAVLGNLSGYTECKAVMFESTTATDDEVALIIRTLKSGVYL